MIIDAVIVVGCSAVCLVSLLRRQADLDLVIAPDDYEELDAYLYGIEHTLRQKNAWTPYTVENTSTGGLAPLAVPPALDHEQPVQIRTGWLFGGIVEPETPNAEQIEDLRRTRIATKGACAFRHDETACRLEPL